MKTLLFFSLSAFTINTMAAECRTSETTELRMMSGKIEQGSLAVNHTGTPITIDDILRDAMIHFKNSQGEISESYQWMYARINPVQNRTNKFLASSYGEDVIITIKKDHENSDIQLVEYVGTRSGNYLNLICK